MVYLVDFRSKNVDVSREMNALKTAISDVLNKNQYDKHNNKKFLKEMAKNNDINMPVD